MALSSEQILDAMRVPPNADWPVFQVGCTSSPLNFASQQIRAFKLVRALELKKLIANKDIAIIGAGLAGLTAAISCLYRGAKKITLYDRNHELMALQHGATHRYIHPQIYRWPEDGAEESGTRFPAMNWNEGTADDIRTGAIEELHQLFIGYYNAWLAEMKQRIKKKTRGENVRIESAPYANGLPQVDMELASEFLQYRLGTEVRQIIPPIIASDEQITFLAEGHESIYVKARNEYLPVGAVRNYQRRYDVAIVAAGFGLESEFPGVPFKSYWQQDTLAQPTIRGNWPKRWMVMGTGDGGLIDAVRLRLFDSDQKLLTDVLTGKKSPPIANAPPLATWSAQVKRLRRAFLTIDQGTRDDCKLDGMSPEKRNSIETKNAVALDIQRRFIEINHHDDREFQAVFKALKAFLESRERTDTVVYLNGRSAQPYDLSSALFHRFLVYLLIRHCGLRYRPGTPQLLSAPPVGGGNYRFAFDREAVPGTRVPIEHLEVDEVVVRHGAESALGALFGGGAILETRKNLQLAKLDKSLSDDRDSTWNDWPSKPVIPKDRN